MTGRSGDSRFYLLEVGWIEQAMVTLGELQGVQPEAAYCCPVQACTSVASSGDHPLYLVVPALGHREFEGLWILQFSGRGRERGGLLVKLNAFEQRGE